MPGSQLLPTVTSCRLCPSRLRPAGTWTAGQRAQLGAWRAWPGRAGLVWQLRGEGEDRETRAARLIGVTFFALAACLAVDGIRDLVTSARPGQSAVGLAVAGAALLVMPALAVAKRRTGRALGNRTLVADSAETAFCAFTSAATLMGVGLNTWLESW
jgi:hypothetical protein